MPACHQEGVLAAHNQYRRRHGAPPLQWSDECMVYAQKCADENSKNRRARQCFLDTEITSRRMGQNIYFGGGPAENAVRYWYEEGGEYNFDKPGFQTGTGHFSAVVWYDTTHVGMARSMCGMYLVANYYPAGNWDTEDSFKKNVLPLSSAFAWRPRNGFEQRLADHFGKIAEAKGYKDGMQVPKDELVTYLQLIGERRLAASVSANDKDGDGNIHAGEFISALSEMRHSDEGNFAQEVDANLRRIVGFVHVDANGDGLLDEQEFLHYLTTHTHRKITEEDARDILKKFDKDDNGFLDYKELTALHDSGLFQQLNNYVLIKKWDKDIAKSLLHVPLPGIIDTLRVHLSEGGQARMLLTQDQLIVKLSKVSDTGHTRVNILQGSWDSGNSRGTTRRPGTKSAVQELAAKAAAETQ